MIITEPKWKKLVVETTGPIFTPQLCQELIDLSKTLPREKGTIAAKIEKQQLDLNTIVAFVPHVVNLSLCKIFCFHWCCFFFLIVH